MSDLSALIARLERATGPSNDLDEAIAAVALTPDGVDRLVAVPGASAPVQMYRYPDGSRGSARRFSHSLDAALTLVPEGWTVARINQNDDRTWAVELRRGFLTSYTAVVFGSKEHKDPTPALGVCVASLRARQPAPPPQEGT